mmetsp:Transcript_9637/g.21927  ORF Transcript_9637/g.21927 Transcript_9637/m.21927 type:complete len:246 (+) Transcript_9637:1230-1967(+)
MERELCRVVRVVQGEGRGVPGGQLQPDWHPDAEVVGESHARNIAGDVQLRQLRHGVSDPVRDRNPPRPDHLHLHRRRLDKRRAAADPAGDLAQHHLLCILDPLLGLLRAADDHWRAHRLDQSSDRHGAADDEAEELGEDQGQDGEFDHAETARDPARVPQVLLAAVQRQPLPELLQLHHPLQHHHHDVGVVQSARLVVEYHERAQLALPRPLHPGDHHQGHRLPPRVRRGPLEHLRHPRRWHLHP